MRRKPKRKNRKIKFSEKEYLKKNYLRDGKGIIPIELNNISDLYMKYDYKKLELSDEFCNYVDEIAYMFSVDTDLIIEIHCPVISEEDQEKIKKSIKTNYGIEIDDVEYDIHLQNRRSNFLIVLASVLMIINYLIDGYVTDFISDCFSVVWWIAIWDGIEIQLIDKVDNKYKRLNCQQLYDAKIEFVFDK